MDGYFRLRTYTVPSGSRPKQSTNEAEGQVYGWDGMDGMEYQKCSSMFFMLCGYIEHVYIHLYIYSKIAANIIMGFKFDVKDAVG